MSSSIEEQVEEGIDDGCDVGSQFDFNTIPIRALNTSARMLLSKYLNPEQVITTCNGRARDYRGIAELMGFSYSEVRNHQRSTDPTRSLLEAFETMSTKDNAHTFAKLITMLEEIERYDIIDDVTPSLKTDAVQFIERFQQSQCNGASGQGTFNRSTTFNFPIESPRHLTVDDALNPNVLSTYDAYVCYADADYQFVNFLSEYLESEQVGLKLFIRDRDLLLGTMEYDAFIQLIMSRCNRMLIIMTPEFFESHECELQTKFAASMAPGMQTRKLIPIIYKRCVLPPIIKFLTKIDLSQGTKTPGWTWRKLVVSIKGVDASRDTMFIPPSQSMPSITMPTATQYLALPDSRTLPTAPPMTNSAAVTEILDSLPAYSALSLPSPVASKLNEKSEKIVSTTSSLTSSSSSSSVNVKSSKKSGWIMSIKQKLKGSSAGSSSSSYAQLDS